MDGSELYEEKKLRLEKLYESLRMLMTNLVMGCDSAKSVMLIQQSFLAHLADYATFLDEQKSKHKVEHGERNGLGNRICDGSGGDSALPSASDTTESKVSIGESQGSEGAEGTSKESH